MPGVQNFPFISVEEFAEGCVRLGERLKRGGIGEAMLSHEMGGVYGLIVRRELVVCPGGDGNEREDEDEKVQNGGAVIIVEDEDEDEDDDEESLHPPSPSRWKVEYQILLSKTYQLPILYFNLYPPSTLRIPASLQQVYENLTSTTTRDVLKSVGVQGAISQADHPVLGVPYYFVHPCNTAAAMSEWQQRRRDGGGEDFDVEKYLTVWIGVVGGAVGLFLPSGCMA
ncbi:hypothetical protein HOY80DRAFT_956120 [Tuber brumale]|nr:hypothetical protein HOY80DRAFT_956120 [Tuber brumale]